MKVRPDASTQQVTSHNFYGTWWHEVEMTFDLKRCLLYGNLDVFLLQPSLVGQLKKKNHIQLTVFITTKHSERYKLSLLLKVYKMFK